MGQRFRWRINRFYGGMSTGSKVGVEGSFVYGQGLDFRSDPDLLQPLYAMGKDSGTTVTDLIKWIVQDGITPYAYGDKGNLYRKLAGGWSNIRAVASSFGQGLEVYYDYLYYAQTAQLGRYGALSGSPSFTDAYQTLTSDADWHPMTVFLDKLCIGNGRTLATLDSSAVWTSNAITLPIGWKIKALEVSGDYLWIGAFKGDVVTDYEIGALFSWDGVAGTYLSVEMLPESGVNALKNYKNSLYVFGGTKGNVYQFVNGNYVKIKRVPGVTAGLAADVWPGAVTGWNGLLHFGFAGTPWTVDQRQVTVDASQALGEANVTTKAYRLVQSFKPAARSLAGVRLWKAADTGSFTGTVTISLDSDASGVPAYDALATVTITNAAYLALAVGEFLAVFAAAYSSLTPNSTYWIRIETSTDDTSNHPNLGVNSAGGYASGTLKKHNSADGYTDTSTDLYFKTLPTIASSLYQGVYTWSQVEKNYPNVLNLDYPISTGTVQGSTLQIGAVRGVSPTELYVGWKDAGTYGIDLISTSTKQTTVIYESLHYDAGAPLQKKTFTTVRVLHAPYTGSEAIAVKYKADRAASWTTLTASTETLNTTTYFRVPFRDSTGEVKAREMDLRIEASNGAKVIEVAVEGEISEEE